MPKYSDLIYDVGFHQGEDTAYYLKKGFRVVAFEAHPTWRRHSTAVGGGSRFCRLPADSWRSPLHEDRHRRFRPVLPGAAPACCRPAR